VHLKTDNAGLFEFSLEEFAQAKMTVMNLTRDLHHSPWNEGNVTTTYEERFKAAGLPILRVEAAF